MKSAERVEAGDRVLTPGGVAVQVVAAWPVCFGYWRAFIGEDASGARHHFERHRESPVSIAR